MSTEAPSGERDKSAWLR